MIKRIEMDCYLKVRTQFGQRSEWYRRKVTEYGIFAVDSEQIAGADLVLF